MDNRQSKKKLTRIPRLTLLCVGTLAALLACPFNVFSNNPVKPYRPERRTTSPVAPEWPDTINVAGATGMLPEPSYVEGEQLTVRGDSVLLAPADTAMIATGATTPKLSADDIVYEFNPDPTRAVWLSALFPGLGQLYNRRYWKLPIIIGGFMGLGYATSWNNGMLRDYSRAYADVMDNDPSTKSYMDFFPSTTREEDLNPTWLQNTFKSRKDYYRRNRDLCIICIVGVYLLAMVDAYVDASLSHFDISPSLTMDVAPAIIPDARDKLPGIGLQWALNF